MKRMIVAHQIRWDESKRLIEIVRVMQDNSEVLFTHLQFEEAEKKAIKKFAQELGEALIVDSPVGRKLFDL